MNTQALLPGDLAAFEEQRLLVLLTLQRALRWQTWVIAASIAVTVVLGGAPWWLALTWFGAFMVLREWRTAAMWRIENDRERPFEQRLRASVAWTLALAAGLGLAAFFMLLLDTTFSALLSMMLLCVSAIAPSKSYTVQRVAKGFTLLIALPVGLMWLWHGGLIGWGVAALVAMFASILFGFADQHARTFEESYGIRLENLALLRQLDAERERLAQARDEAVRADLAKSRFLASASHDLRQPLQCVTLHAGALSRMPLEGEALQVARELALSVEDLRALLEALLDVSKLDACAVQPELRSVPLARLLEALAARFAPAARDKGLSLTVRAEPDLVVTSDVSMLQRVLANLIDNAIKFTDGGEVHVSAEREGERVRVAVADTGVGIPANDQQHVFDDLVQLANPERDRSRGHGLGLGIVRRLAQLLGTECRLESAPGEGARFTLSLPAAAAEPVARESLSPALVAAAPLPALPLLQGRRVLVLDDDAAVRQAYARALQGLGAEVTAVGDLPSALAACSADAAGHPPDLALVDHRLADGVTGLDAISRLRGCLPRLPALLVSADANRALYEAAAVQGLPLLRKPVSEASLQEALRGVLPHADAMA